MKKLIINQQEEKTKKQIHDLELMSTSGTWFEEKYSVFEDELYDIEYDSSEYDFYIKEDDANDRYIYRKKK